MQHYIHRRFAFETLEHRRQLSVTFIDSGQILGDSGSINVALGDLDADGDLDAMVLNEDTSRVWLNDGLGNLSDSGQEIGRPLDVHEDTPGKTVALADLDADGDLDAILSARGDNAIWLNDGLGVFHDSGIGMTGGKVALGDVNADGTLDAVIVCGCFRIRSDHVWMNDGKGKYVDAQQSGNGLGYDVSLGDLDDDGDLDTFVATRIGPNEVWRNEGGKFAEPEFVGSEDVSSDYHRVRVPTVDLGDVDGDGDLDVFVAGAGDRFALSGIVKVRLNDGTGRFRLAFTDDSQNSQDVKLGDLDGDGDLDAIVVGDRNKVWVNDGGGTFTAIGMGDGDESRGLAIGDLDGDGDLDAFIANVGPNRVWVNESRAIQFAAGDVNRDLQFDQQDIVQVLQVTKYLTGEPATFEQGDWDGDGVFDSLDLVAALQTGNYLQGPYAMRTVDATFAENEN